MDKDKLKLILICLICFLFSMSIIGIMAIGGEAHYESYECVDGLGNKNLEGIMCEKGVLELFGYELDQIPMLLLMLLIIVPLMFSAGSLAILFASRFEE